MKTFNIILLLLVFTFINSDASAETKRDCSQYSTKTLAGLGQKMRCKKGLPPLKKNFLKSIEFKSLKKNSKPTYIPGKPCDEYSTKTLVGLSAKIKCKRNK